MMILPSLKKIQSKNTKLEPINLKLTKKRRDIVQKVNYFMGSDVSNKVIADDTI